MRLILRCLARPLSLLVFVSYKWDVRRAPFPEDAPEPRIAGPAPYQLLFIGDVAMAGYGVLRHGMATPPRTANLIASARSRGCQWETIAAADLTAAAVARRETLHSAGVDAVVIMLGIPDVLLGTKEPKWTTSLRKITSRIAEEAGPLCPVVFVAIPKMTDFRPIPDPARRLLKLQTLRLNQGLRQIAEESPRGSYVVLPNWRTGETYVADTFSWKAMHKMLARALAPAIMKNLSADKSFSSPEDRVL